MVRFCSQCGSRVNEGDKFCMTCGSPIASAPSIGDLHAHSTGCELNATVHIPEQPDPFAYMPVDLAYNDPVASAYASTSSAAPAQTARFTVPASRPVQKKDRSTVIVVIAATVAVVSAIAVGLFTFDPFGWRDAAPPVGQAAESGAVQVDGVDEAQSISNASSQVGAGAAKQEALQQLADTVNAASIENDDFVLPESDLRTYDVAELAGLSTWDLRVARNEIYARHGRGFSNKQMQAYFDSKNWYTRLYDPDEFDEAYGSLSDVELQNTEIIRSVEGAES